MQMAGTSVMAWSLLRTRTGTCILGLMRWKFCGKVTSVALTVAPMGVNWSLDSWRRMCGHSEQAPGAR